MEKNLISLYDFSAIFDIDNQYSKEFITTNQAIVVSDCKTEITVAREKGKAKLVAYSKVVNND